MVLAEGSVEVEAAALEAEDGCVPGGAVVGREVGSGGIRCNIHIGIVRRSGGEAVICFCMPARTKGTAYSVIGGGALYRRRRQSLKGKLAQIVRKCNE